MKKETTQLIVANGAILAAAAVAAVLIVSCAEPAPACPEGTSWQEETENRAGSCEPVTNPPNGVVPTREEVAAAWLSMPQYGVGGY